MRVVSKIADRLLGAVVPRIKAGACCPQDPTYHSCGYVGMVRVCVFNCACQLLCSNCFYQ